MTPRFIAHRYGNSLAGLRAAEEVVTTVEIDLHVGDDGPEARHAKRIWGTGRLWERWFLLPHGASGIPAEVIEAASGVNTVFWADLKGVDPRLPRQVREVFGDRELMVSTKSWWMLSGFRDPAAVQTFRSAGNRWELAVLLVRQMFPSRIDGAVVHRRLLTPTILRRLLKNGEVYTWSANDVPTIVSLAQGGVAGFIVDELDVVAEAKKLLDR